MSKHNFWHLTLTYNPNLTKVKVNLHTIKVIRESIQSWEAGQTDGDYQANYLPVLQYYEANNKLESM